MSEGSLRPRTGKRLTAAFAALAALLVSDGILRIPALADRLALPARCALIRAKSKPSPGLVERDWQGTRLRSLHLEARPAAGVRRIVVLGDSFSWGDGVDETRRIWPYVLESELQARGAPFQIINLARCGATTVNEQRMLETFGWDFDPEWVIVQYFLNDPLPAISDFDALQEDWMRERVDPWFVPQKVHHFLSYKSYLYGFIDRLRSLAIKRIWGIRDLTYIDLHQEGFPAWEATKAAIREMKTSCVRKRKRLLFVIFPAFGYGRLDGTYPFSEPHRRIGDVLRENGIPYLDLLPVYAREDPDGMRWAVHRLDPHPNVRAHRLAAQAVAEVLDRT